MLRFAGPRATPEIHSDHLGFRSVDAFESFVRCGLELRGIAVDETDLAVMRGADGVYGPAIRALLAADLASVAPEPALDPSHAPREPAAP